MERGKAIFSALGFLAVISALIVLSCSSARKFYMYPDLPTVSNAGFRIHGKISYDGDREYLPRVVAEGRNSPLVFQYTYRVGYGAKDTESLGVYIGLPKFGYPTGEDTVAIGGKLSILEDNKTLKSYTAACIIKVTRGLYSGGETFTELRREGLIAVRDNIDSQMMSDREFLIKLMRDRNVEQ